MVLRAGGVADFELLRDDAGRIQREPRAGAGRAAPGSLGRNPHVLRLARLAWTGLG